MAIRRKTKFAFHKRPLEDLRKRQNQSGGNRDSWLKDSVKVWVPPVGKSRIRFLPPTWEDATHFGQDVYVHYGIGTDRSSYVCLDPKKNEFLDSDSGPCPLCAARQKHQTKGNEELAQALAPNKRVCAWMIHRDRESDGPQLWPMPYTIDKDIASQCQDDETKEVIYVDDPDKGYDIILNREGMQQKTKYQARLGKECPLSRDDDLYDEWLEYVTDNPVPEMIVVAEPDHMEDALAGGVQLRGDDRSRRRRSDDEDEEEEKPRRRSRSGVDDEDEEEEALRGPSRRRRPTDDEDDEDEEPAKPRSRSRRQQEEEDDDEDEASRSRRGATAASSRSSRLKTREADDEEDDTAEADEEEKPTRRGTATAASSKRSRRAVDEADEEADDDDDSDPPPRSSGRDKLRGVSRRK